MTAFTGHHELVGNIGESITEPKEASHTVRVGRDGQAIDADTVGIDGDIGLDATLCNASSSKRADKGKRLQSTHDHD